MKKPVKGVDYIGVGVGAVIVNDDGKILLAKRGKKAQNERGKWEFPGGTVEFGDTMKDTILREIKEELGMEIELGDKLPSIDHLIPEEKQHWVTSAYIARTKAGKPKIKEPEKCEEIGWFDFEQIENMIDELSIASRQYIPYIKKFFKSSEGGLF